jgi:arginyl-tRNA synthetase
VRLSDDDYFGESFYNDQLQSAVDELEALGMLQLPRAPSACFPRASPAATVTRCR